MPRSTADRLLLILPPDDALRVNERHLGLVTAAEGGIEGSAIAAAARPHLPISDILAAVEAAVNARRPAAPNSRAAPSRSHSKCPTARIEKPGRFRLALAVDEAFSFYYPDNLEALKAAGASIVPFSPLRDRQLPDCDLVFFGGGFPELYAEALSDNSAMRASVLDAARSGMPMYAECGGLMYLSAAIGSPDGGSYAGVGVFPFETRFDRLVIGYAEIEARSDCLLGPSGTRARGHVFHRSSLLLAENVECVLNLRQRGEALSKAVAEGYRIGNVLATWAHIHFASAPSIPSAFARTARNRR
jgi:cobyrinic acid a,c-diamide synthase